MILSIPRKRAKGEGDYFGHICGQWSTTRRLLSGKHLEIMIIRQQVLSDVEAYWVESLTLKGLDARRDNSQAWHRTV